MRHGWAGLTRAGLAPWLPMVARIAVREGWDVDRPRTVRRAGASALAAELAQILADGAPWLPQLMTAAGAVSADRTGKVTAEHLRRGA
ncbi:hypothetical protein [Streptomyces sp. NPDC051219]|uniref:hypothetical protein n=1 Tax=Streptomyces sp. NPDC051219 TaxID=3155283 RepID=UPI00341ECD4F